MFLTKDNLEMILHSIGDITTNMNENKDSLDYIYNQVLDKLKEYDIKEPQEYSLNDLKCGCIEISKFYPHLKQRDFFDKIFLNIKDEVTKDLIWRALTNYDNILNDYSTIILDNSNSNLPNILHIMSCEDVEFSYKTYDELVFTSNDFKEVYSSYNLDI